MGYLLSSEFLHIKIEKERKLTLMKNRERIVQIAVLVEMLMVNERILIVRR